MSGRTKKKSPRDRGSSQIEKQFFRAAPLPHPETLKLYEENFPGATREILEMAKRDQEHAIFLDQSNVSIENRRLVMFFCMGVIGQVGVLCIALSGFILAYTRPELARYGFWFSAIVCSYLIWWKVRNKKNPE